MDGTELISSLSIRIFAAVTHLASLALVELTDGKASVTRL